MKVRNSNKEGEKIEPQMAPMIDVVFQLLIFFMLTLKIVAPEGDFNINMPIGAPSSESSTVDIPPIKVRLVAATGGELARLELGRRDLGNDSAAFQRLNAEILRIIGRPNDGFGKEMEVEIEADYDLHYKYTIQAVGACTGRMDSKGRLIRYVEKIKFAPPKKPAGV